MTNREFYQAIINIDYDAELTQMAQKMLAQLDARNEHRKNTPTKEQKAAAERREAVLTYLQEHPTEVYTRDQIAEALSISAGQVSSACTALKDVIKKDVVLIDKVRKTVYQIAETAEE